MDPSMSFKDFVNTVKPIYEGNSSDNVTITVSLTKMYDGEKYGYGRITPYTIPSMYRGLRGENKDPHCGCFELFGSNIIEFSEDNYSEATVLKLKVSTNFESLTIIDIISGKAKEVLHLKKN